MVIKKKTTAKKKTTKKLSVVPPVQDTPELQFQNRMEELIGLQSQKEYCSSLYAATQRFHKEVAALNKRFNLNVKDIVFFKIK